MVTTSTKLLRLPVSFPVTNTPKQLPFPYCLFFSTIFLFIPIQYYSTLFPYGKWVYSIPDILSPHYLHHCRWLA